eukprot:3775209-Rhodomonas_salina.2
MSHRACQRHSAHACAHHQHLAHPRHPQALRLVLGSVVRITTQIYSPILYLRRYSRYLYLLFIKTLEGGTNGTVVLADRSSKSWKLITPARRSSSHPSFDVDQCSRLMPRGMSYTNQHSFQKSQVQPRVARLQD